MVTGRSCERRGHQSLRSPIQCCRRGNNHLNCLDVGLRVPDHTTSTNPLPAHLKLGFHQNECLRLRSGQQASQGRKNQTQGYEGHIGDRQGRPWISLRKELVSLQMTQVRPLPQHHSRIRSQAPGRLAIADINAIDPRRSVLQQAIREPSGGDPAVQADAAVHVDRKGCQSSQQLLATPGDKPLRMLHTQFALSTHHGPGLIENRAGPITHLSCADQLLCLLT